MEHLNREFAPPGIDARTHNGIGDAFRHYMSYAELQRRIGSYLARKGGQLGESEDPATDPEANMDTHNNDSGIASGERSDNGTDDALNFMNDVAAGRVRVVENGRVRDTSAADLPHRDGNMLEDRYRPDRVDPRRDPTRDNDTMIA